MVSVLTGNQKRHIASLSVVVNIVLFLNVLQGFIVPVTAKSKVRSENIPIHATLFLLTGTIILELYAGSHNIFRREAKR